MASDNKVLGDDPFAPPSDATPSANVSVNASESATDKPKPDKAKAKPRAKHIPKPKYGARAKTAAATSTVESPAPSSPPLVETAPPPPPAASEPRGPFVPSRGGEHAGERTKLPLEFFWKRWRDIAMRDRSDVVDEFGRDPGVSARIDPLLDFFYRTYFRVEARGLGHIPERGRALIVANHSGTLPYDGAMLMHAIRQEHAAHRDLRPLVEDFVFHFPYLGTLMNRIGGVRACPENAERLLEQDQLVAVFPEGIKGVGKLYRERYRLQRFGRGGFVKIALRSDAPIIPTAIVGAEEIHPMLTKITWLAKSIGIPYIPITPTFPLLGPIGLLPLPSKWFVAFGEPLYYNAEYGREGADDRILVNRLAEQVRGKIQEMVDTLVANRRSVLFG